MARRGRIVSLVRGDCETTQAGGRVDATRGPMLLAMRAWYFMLWGRIWVWRELEDLPIALRLGFDHMAEFKDLEA